MRGNPRGTLQGYARERDAQGFHRQSREETEHRAADSPGPRRFARAPGPRRFTRAPIHAGDADAGGRGCGRARMRAPAANSSAGVQRVEPPKPRWSSA